MLTDLDRISTPRPTYGPRSSAAMPHTLPDSQSLLELSLREIESAVNELRGKLNALRPQLIGGSLPNPEHLDRSRSALRHVCAGLLRHLEVSQDRIADRHHSQGRFGSTIGKLQAAFAEQTNQLLTNQQQIGELLAEYRPEPAWQRLNAIADNLHHSMERVAAVLHGIRKTDRHPHSITLGGAHRQVHERQHVRDQLAWSLRRWWQTCTVQPGPMTIAVIDQHRLASDYPELSRDAVCDLLQAAADLIVSDRRFSRSGIAIDTTVISAEGHERYLAWSCAVIEDPRGHAQSIIAAGLDKTGCKPAKPRPEQEPAVAVAAASLSASTEAGSERRRKQRNPFPYVQLIAPSGGAGLPPTSVFFEALCHDISEDGFSFLSAAMPTATSLVVALGTRPPHLYMTARVAHFTRCETSSGAKYIVGCQFTGRAMVMAQFA